MKINLYSITTVLIFLTISLITVLMTIDFLFKKEKQLQSKKYTLISLNTQEKIKSIINKKKNATLALTITLSSNYDVLNILKKKKASPKLHNLSLLLKDETEFKNVWFHVLDNKGISLYRSWSDNKNDQVTQVRKDVVSMLENPSILSTISVGKYDMTFKAMVPIFDDNNMFIGIIESITHFNSISRGLTLNEMEPLVVVEKKFTKQLEKNAFTDTFLQGHYIANLLANKKVLDFFEEKDINEFIQDKPYVLEDDYLIINTPIIYENEKLANFLVFYNINEIDMGYIKEYKQNVFLYLVLFLIMIALILFVISYYLYSKELKKLYFKLNENQEKLFALNNTLKKTVDEEVSKNYKKTKILFQQSKMAAMGEMIGNIAHQWRQPLSIITSLASALKLKKELGILDEKDYNNSLESIINSANHLSHTIDDFRYFFIPNKDKTKIYSDELFEKVFKLLRPELNTKSIKIINNIQKVLIQTYENELIQVIINIINNAKDELVKIDDFKSRYISVDVYESEKNLVIELKDSAGGISEDIIERIFEPYFTTKHKSQGTGIGLYMSEEIISKHLNGKIIVENKESIFDNKKLKGAEFIISLPLNDKL